MTAQTLKYEIKLNSCKIPKLLSSRSVKLRKDLQERIQTEFFHFCDWHLSLVYCHEPSQVLALCPLHPLANK